MVKAAIIPQRDREQDHTVIGLKLICKC